MRDKRIVLVGWRLSSYFNHRVVQLIHGVSAIIDLAFNQKTQYGYRGVCFPFGTHLQFLQGPDDDILLTYCPSLFVVGSHSTSFDAVKLKELRGSMQCGLLYYILFNKGGEAAWSRPAQAGGYMSRRG